MSNILEGLNDAQRKVATTIQGKLCVVAGPGTGKTHTMVRRVAYMIEQGIAPENILMFTFTRKAAGELKERVQNVIGERGAGVTTSTYHSFCGKLLRKYIGTIGYASNFSIYDDEDKTSVLTRILDALKETDSSWNDITIPSVLSQISYWKENMMSVSDAINSGEASRMSDIYERYTQALREDNALDFDDLIYYTIRILESNQEVQEEVNNKYRYIIQDESQDSAPASDLRLTALLAGPNDKDWNLCMIGDDWQSIYSFRGSNIAAYIQFVHDHNMPILALEQNYRSTQTVVNASNKLIKHNEVQIDKTPFTDNEVGNKITMATLDTEADEAKTVTKYIRAAVMAGYDYKDIAVLYRTGKQSKNIEDALLPLDIPYKVIGGVPFCSRKEVKDILAYARITLNQKDREAFNRVANVPRRGIGAKTLELISDYIATHEGADIVTACNNVVVNKKTRVGLNQFSAIIEDLCEVAGDIEINGRTMDEFIDRILVLTDYAKFLQDTCTKSEYQERMDNIEELRKIAGEYTVLTDLVESLVSKSESVNQTDDNCVNLMTMHSSKGLEFPLVIIVGANEGTCPHFLSIREQNVEEERRLFFVAATRAKQELFITRAKRVFFQNRFQFTRESRFIGEIGSKYIQRR